ncbi:Peroxiredoxin-6 [Dactylella cylindrospora]|nr:Peroxiredoxin-6 [Dactylella cylindrospora]
MSLRIVLFRPLTSTTSTLRLRQGASLFIVHRSRFYTQGSSKRQCPSHRYPGQKIHDELISVIKKRTSLHKADQKWKVIFTCHKAFDPVSTTNVKSFGEHRHDFLARDAEVVAIVASTDKDATKWIENIEDLVQDQQGVDRGVDGGAEGGRGFIFCPVISDPQLSIHHQLGFVESELGSTPEGAKSRPPPLQHHLLHIIDPDYNVKLTQTLPISIGFNVLDVLRTLYALQTSEDYDILIPSDWSPGKDALMPVGRRRSSAGINALKLDTGVDDDAEQEGGILPIADEGNSLSEDGQELAMDGERMPPGDVWKVLPYLNYVRIDNSVDNSASVIGYERMRTDLLRSFERFKADKEEKDQQKRDQGKGKQGKMVQRKTGNLR